MAGKVVLIGFGEAGRSFVAGGLAAAAAYDIDPGKQTGLAAGHASMAILDDARTILSLVTADQALIAAGEAAARIEAGALYLDMNSVAPDTKRAAARVVESAGGRYVDVAVMAPVDPARLAVPLLVSGPYAGEGANILEDLGFSNVRALHGEVGRASAVKMVRSVMVKGIEALTAEMMLAGDKAGVSDEVLASLGDDWAKRATYNIERMKTHGRRRAAEMEEVAKTLVALGVDPVMTRGTVVRQREMADDPPSFARSAIAA